MASISDKSNGFTLVEMAITLTIIGLLVAGVLKGIELFNNAKIVNLIAQVESYETATKSFLNIYGALPGDIKSPSTRLPNCTSTECAASGNADKRICVGPGVACTGRDGLTGIFGLGSEPVAYWRHLVAANLIVGFRYYEDMTAAERSESPYSGGWHAYGPESPLGGRWMPMYFNRPATDAGGGDPSYPYIHGHFVRLRGYNGAQGITTTFAARIDSKIDDGIPNSGRVLGVSRYCHEETTPNVYAYAINGFPGNPAGYVNGPNCEILISIEN